MTNLKRKKFSKAIKRIPKDKLGKEDLLSEDLPLRIGSLKNREKITIRLDPTILEAARRESVERGVGYQKIINDKLLEIYTQQTATYLQKDSLVEIKQLLKDMQTRLEKLEKENKRKRA